MGFGYNVKNIERLNFHRMKPETAEGTAKDITTTERQAIEGLFQGKVHLYDMDCLTFLRDRAILS